MRLLRIELSNFRQYKNQEIFFPQDGLIGVLGSNGAGKSTLFNAIGWCFYGKIKGVTNAMIKNQNASSKDQCYVIVDFIFQGKLYRIKRDLVSSRCYALVDGLTKAVGTTSLNAFVEEDVFKLDYQAFCTCYYAEQDDFDALVKLNPGPRVQTLSKLLRIETIDKAAEKARKDYRVLEMETSEAKKHLKDEDVLFSERKEKEESASLFSKAALAAEKRFKELHEEYKDLLVQKASGEQNNLEYQRLLQEEDNAFKQISSLTKVSLEPSEEKLVKLFELEKKYHEMLPHREIYQKLIQEEKEMAALQVSFNEKRKTEDQKKDIEAEVKSYASEIENLKNMMLDLGEPKIELDQKENDKKALESEINALRENFQEQKFELNSKKKEFEDLKLTKDKYDELGSDSPCPTCERPLGEHYGDRINHIQEEMAKITNEAKSVQIQMKKLDEQIKEKEKLVQSFDKEIKTLREQQGTKEKANERLILLTSEINKRKETYKSLKTKLEELKDVSFDQANYQALLDNLEKENEINQKIFKVEAAIETIPSLKEEIEKIKAEIAKNEKTIDEVGKALVALNFDQKAYQKISDEIENIQQEAQKKKEEKLNSEGNIKVLESEIKAIDEKMNENKKIISSIKQKEQEMVLLAKLDEVYKQYKTDKLSKLAPALSSIMSDLMDTITDGKYDQIELDDKYNISIYRQGVKNTLDFYSGGEKKLAALTQRLAISSLLVNQTGQASFEMLAMDEVFGAMDSDRQDSIMEMLRNLNEKFPQILMVTHSEATKEQFDFVLDIKQDANGFSNASWNADWDTSDIVDELSIYDETNNDDDEVEEVS